MQKFYEKGYVSGLDGLDSYANRNFQIACMGTDTGKDTAVLVEH